jgi:hypothetical protein
MAGSRVGKALAAIELTISPIGRVASGNGRHREQEMADSSVPAIRGPGPSWRPIPPWLPDPREVRSGRPGSA